ncbi:MAG: hypothetical protein ABFD89_12510 [Bryobacteraceae bacterium]
MGYVSYKTAGTAGQESPIIWATFDGLKARANRNEYVEVYDDFTGGGVVTDTSVPGWDLTGTNADVEQVVDVANGQILMEGSGADNDSCTIASPDLYLLTKDSGKRFWFEACVKLSAAGAADDFAAFVGLIEKTGATAELIADNGATVIDEDFVGFFADSDATAIQPWNCTINIGGDASFPVTVEANAVALSTSYVKLGMAFDGRKTVSFYADGVLLDTYDIDGLTGNTMNHEFCVVLGVKDCEAAQLGLSVDWVHFAAEKNVSGY